MTLEGKVEMIKALIQSYEDKVISVEELIYYIRDILGGDEL